MCLPYVKQPMATLCNKGWNGNQPREAGSLLRMIAHVASAKTCGGKGEEGLSDATRNTYSIIYAHKI